jgi:uncharacterized paraquat-inducible protein A
MLLSQCPSCDHQFWLPRVQPRRYAGGLWRINAYFCPSCGASLRMQRWMVWTRSGAIFAAFLCLMMIRFLPAYSGLLRALAIAIPVVVIFMPKKYDLLEPQP